MLRYHMSVITRDVELKRSIKRLTTATGSTADYVQDPAESQPTRPVNLAIFDARHEMPGRRFLSQLPKTARILYIVSPEGLSQRIELFDDPRVTSLFCHDEQFDDDEFISSATKALRGEVFGLQKYFPWGVTTFTMKVTNYEEKGRAIDIMMRYAQMAGVRGPVRDRIQLVSDELMMNALYHAPVDEHGREKYEGMTLKELAQLPQVNPIQVQYGCSGRYFGVAVRDAGGSLRRDRALEYLRRAHKGQSEIEQKTSGAGLGLISVLHSVSKLVFNLDPGSSTEVIGLFDMQLFSRGKVGARSLHLFVAPPIGDAVASSTDTPGADDHADTRVDNRAAPPPPRSGTWLLAAILGAVLASLLTVYYFKRISPPAAQADKANHKTLAIVAEPTAAEIRVNGALIPAGEEVAVPPEATEVQITVSHEDYETWSQTLHSPNLSDNERIFVRLNRTQ